MESIGSTSREFIGSEQPVTLLPLLSAAEFLFLLWAVYLCYAVRTVPSAFHEPRYMAIAVHNELVLSAIFYVIR